MAIVGLAERLKKDPRTDARLIYVEALGHINHPATHGPLAMCAIDDDVPEVRLSCLDELEKQKDPGVTAYFVGGCATSTRPTRSSTAPAWPWGESRTQAASTR